MNLLRDLFVILISSLIIGCDQIGQNKNNYSHTLTLKEVIKIPIDENTSFNNNNLKIFEEDGNEYLIIQNDFLNSLQFYSLENLQLTRKIVFNKEGPQGIDLHGFVIPNPDSIIIFNKFSSQAFIVDRNGNKIDTIFVSGRNQYLNHASMNRIPDLYYDNKINLFVFPPQNYREASFFSNKHLFELEYDLKTKGSRYLPITWPKRYENSIWGFYHTFPCRTLGKDGELIYSFAIDENIYVLDQQDSLLTYQAKSDFIDEKIIPLSRLPETNLEEAVNLLNRGFYSMMIYDKYREVYYRIAGHQTRYNKELGYLQNVYNKSYSVIILDKEFKKIGEKKLRPINSFSIKDFFVAKKGLYIQSSNINNPNLEEDYLEFNLMKLEEI